MIVFFLVTNSSRRARPADNATATINPGQKVGTVGKNGCGKSTLLALLKMKSAPTAAATPFREAGNWRG